MTALAHALKLYRERAEVIIEQASQDADRDDSGGQPQSYWASVLTSETAYLAEEGPEAYMRYVAKLDDAAERARLNEHLEQMLEPGRRHLKAVGSGRCVCGSELRQCDDWRCYACDPPEEP